MMIKEKPGYSIIIPAYNSENFIKDCINSINNQTHFNNTNTDYEILLGIDACPKTLKKGEKIFYQNPKIRLFNFFKNGGPYKTKNSLIPLAKYDYLLFFDSDDQMDVNMIFYIDKEMSKGYDVCRFKYKKYDNGTDPKINGKTFHRISEGITCHTKRVHEILGGFEYWPCSADTDFRFKCDGIFKVSTIDKPLFFRRMHSTSLTRGKEYGLKTKKRKLYSQIIEKRISSGYYKNPEKVNIKAVDFEEITR
jgi:glycosyltransferase involved in cell wall biosynthesis